MNTLKISVIIPLYNQSQKLMDCLRSIKNQNHPLTPFPRNTRDRLLVKAGEREGVEVIIVNDGSTDITQDALCKSVLQYAPAARCIYQDNQGAPVARNNGFKASSGTYVLFCDADVVMKPDMLQKMARVLDGSPVASYVYSSFKFGWKKFKLWEFDRDKLREMPYIHTTSLIRREHFPGFDPVIKRFQDWDLWLTMLEKGYIGKWIPEILFTVKTGGTMSSWLPSFLTKFVFFGKNKKYQAALAIVRKKHSLVP